MGMVTLYNQSVTVSPSGTATFPDVVVPAGGNIALTIGNHDAANDDLTVTQFEKFPLGASSSGSGGYANDFGNDAAAASAFGTIAHGTAKIYEASGVAYQTLRVTVASTAGVSRAQMQICMVRQEG
jgi:hypothetical protein